MSNSGKQSFHGAGPQLRCCFTNGWHVVEPKNDTANGCKNSRFGYTVWQSMELRFRFLQILENPAINYELSKLARK